MLFMTCWKWPVPPVPVTSSAVFPTNDCFAVVVATRMIFPRFAFVV